jgi:hydroxycarboxylate dehydrogenase B
MPTLTAAQLTNLASDIFHAAGAGVPEARTVAEALVEANLEGHDSHGVVRVPEYVEWMEQGWINAAAKLRVVKETAAFALLDGDWGWGQVMGREAMKIGIEKARQAGAATISVRQLNHIGRGGDYPLLAAQRGMAAIMFVNTHGAGKLVAPWGGRERRLSANPIALAVPHPSGKPVLVDISTCATAGGKVTIAHNSGKQVPPGCILDSEGRPSTNPGDFIGPPEGALLPMAGHKGFALALLGDLLAGGISGAGCSRPTGTRVGNSFLATVIDIAQFRDLGSFDEEVNNLVQYVKSSKLAAGFSEILIPGEPEARERARREAQGIPVDDGTWGQIAETAKRYGVPVA